MRKSIYCGIICICAVMFSGCSSWQPTKNVWKSTKGLWNTYVSPPAYVDYEDKGDLEPEAATLSSALMGVDVQLANLERRMQNADRPPTQEWLTALFASFPWLNGFAGVKYDGTILGQEPADSLKQLDFIPLLYEDKKQHSRALRCDVQPGPLGAEIMLAAPLYDGTDFLGIVVAYFDMRSLMRFSSDAQNIVVLTPQALLWPGKYEYAATPLAGVDWNKAVRESTAGTCRNDIGTFFYMVRYLGNLPLVFAIPKKGDFPEGNGTLEQAAAYFPKEREKLPPPPMPERKNREDSGIPVFEKPEEPEPEPVQAQAKPMPEASDRNVIPQGSRESVLLKRKRARPQRQIEERPLDGDNIAPAAVSRQRRNEPALELIPGQDEGPSLSDGRPSPFGPREEARPRDDRPSPFGPRQESAPAANEIRQPVQSGETESAPAKAPAEKPEQQAAPAEKPAQPTAPAEKQEQQAAPSEKPDTAPTLSGGRPSPFGPRN